MREKDDFPEVAPGQGVEVRWRYEYPRENYRKPLPQTPAVQHVAPTPPPAPSSSSESSLVPPPQPTVCGMPRTVFWMSIALVVVVMLAIAAAAIGGAVAIENKNRAERCEKGGSAFALSGATSSNAPGCDNSSAYTASGGGKYRMMCSTSYNFEDLKMLSTSTVERCADACDLWTSAQLGLACAGFTYIREDSAPLVWDGGVCWLKSGMHNRSYVAGFISGSIIS